MIVTRVEKYTINRNHKYYLLLDNLCFRSKNLYNHANYLVRNHLVQKGEWLRYSELDKLLKEDLEYPDYKNMHMSKSAQQVLKLLDQNYLSFFKSIQDWSENKDKYKGKPKLPKYKNKNGRYIVILTNQQAKLKNDLIKFPKIFEGFNLKFSYKDKYNFRGLQQVRIVPKLNYIVIEVVYKMETLERKDDNGKYMSIDMGLDNLATVVTNTGINPIIINGKGLKSTNKYYNKQVAHYKEILFKTQNKYTSEKLYKLHKTRNAKIDDYIHKASRYIINHALEEDISIIIIGNNKDWKRNSKMSKIVNQSFVGIPHQKLINQIIYKAENVGIEVILTEESYTSGTSFLDNELPIKENYNKKRRIKRGLFVSNEGLKINADVNGAYQIMRKVFPNVKSNGIEGLALNPIRVNLY